MDKFVFAATLVIFALCTAFSFIRSIHMFQLNSYKNKGHLRWLGQNVRKYVPDFILAAAAFACFAGVAGVIAADAIMLIRAMLVRPGKKAKKPLVFTGRVKRMTVTFIILASAAAAIGFFIPLKVSALVLTLFAAFTPVTVVLCNIINYPIEEGIRRHYINDAKRILAECRDLKIIGITGSYGKTSMKFFLGTLLNARYNTLVTPESYNTPMGVVRTVREKLNGTHEIFVCEMGAKQKGDIKELCDIVHPHDGIITSIGPQHLETFKSIETVKSTKYELADALPETGTVFVNADNKYIRKDLPRGAVTYGTTPDCDYHAGDISVSSAGTSFTLTAPDGETQRFTSKLLGEHNVINLVGALAVSRYMGIPFSELSRQIKKITPVAHRLELLETPGATVIDDAYNSNPSGSRAALELLNMLDGYRVLITPGMIELGAEEERYNREFGEQAAKVCDLVVLVGGRQTKPIFAGLTSAGFPESKIIITESVTDAMQRARAVSSERKKIILLENDLPDNY